MEAVMGHSSLEEQAMDTNLCFYVCVYSDFYITLYGYTFDT